MSPRSRPLQDMREIGHLRERNAALKESLADALTLYLTPSSTASQWAAWAEISRGLIQPDYPDDSQTIGDTP